MCLVCWINCLGFFCCVCCGWLCWLLVIVVGCIRLLVWFGILDVVVVLFGRCWLMCILGIVGWFWFICWWCFLCVFWWLFVDCVGLVGFGVVFCRGWCCFLLMWFVVFDWCYRVLDLDSVVVLYMFLSILLVILFWCVDSIGCIFWFCWFCGWNIFFCMGIWIYIFVSCGSGFGWWVWCCFWCVCILFLMDMMLYMMGLGSVCRFVVGKIWRFF